MEDLLSISLDGRVLALQAGDITTVPADAIGNAANAALRGGGGVDGAIHRAGGESIQRELDSIRSRIGRCPPGEAVVTGAGELPARWVLHAVGPVYRDGRSGEAATLASCYEACLRLAGDLGARSLTLPAISTGVYGYPIEQAAEIAVGTVGRGLADSEKLPERVCFVLFGDVACEAFRRAALAWAEELA